MMNTLEDSWNVDFMGAFFSIGNSDIPKLNLFLDSPRKGRYWICLPKNNCNFTPPKTNMEPEKHLFEKENHLNQTPPCLWVPC